MASKMDTCPLWSYCERSHRSTGKTRSGNSAGRSQPTNIARRIKTFHQNKLKAAQWKDAIRSSFQYGPTKRGPGIHHAASPDSRTTSLSKVAKPIEQIIALMH